MTSVRVTIIIYKDLSLLWFINFVNSRYHYKSKFKNLRIFLLFLIVPMFVKSVTFTVRNKYVVVILKSSSLLILISHLLLDHNPSYLFLRLLLRKWRMNFSTFFTLSVFRISVTSIYLRCFCFTWLCFSSRRFFLPQ